MAGRFGYVGHDTVIGRMASWSGAMLFPHVCVACGLEGSMLCRTCQQEISTPLRGVFLCPVCGGRSAMGVVCSGGCRRRSAVDGVASLAGYGHAPLRQLLHEYKYGGVEEAGAILEEIWTDWLERQRPFLSAIAGDATVIPVPLHYFREAWRGFNQADRFAGALGRMTGSSVERSALSRRFRWRPQAKMVSAKARGMNARGSVKVRPDAVVRDRVVIVDDVLTTGSTVQECARVLKDAGAASVWVLTLLRG